MEIPKLRSAEKEAELDKKIEEIRKKNQILEQRHQEIKKDAEANGIPKFPINQRPNKSGKIGSNKDSNFKISEKIGEKKKSSMTESKSKNESNREWDVGKTPADSWKMNVPDIGDHNNKYFVTESNRGKRKGTTNFFRGRSTLKTRNPGYFHDDRLDVPKRGSWKSRRENDRNQNDSNKPNMNFDSEKVSESKTSTEKTIRANKKPSFDDFQSSNKKLFTKHEIFGKNSDLPNQNFRKPKTFFKNPLNRVKNPGQFGAKQSNKKYDSDEKTVKRVLENLIDKVVLFEKKEKRAASNKAMDTVKSAENHVDEHDKNLEIENLENSIPKIDENENLKVEANENNQNLNSLAENYSESVPLFQEVTIPNLEQPVSELATLESVPSETAQPMATLESVPSEAVQPMAPLESVPSEAVVATVSSEATQPIFAN